ncbi:hypothetical protein L843_1344 [Mycobacterium intracellulare MIN_061107_1834]|nr:hypothetical protein L843_1344 [Mycobacterium intracellulare MIN_061107_1834]
MTHARHRITPPCVTVEAELDDGCTKQRHDSSTIATPTSLHAAFNFLSLVQSRAPSTTATDPRRWASIALNPLPHKRRRSTRWRISACVNNGNSRRWDSNLSTSSRCLIIPSASSSITIWWQPISSLVKRPTRRCSATCRWSIHIDVSTRITGRRPPPRGGRRLGVRAAERRETAGALYPNEGLQSLTEKRRTLRHAGQFRRLSQ